MLKSVTIRRFRSVHEQTIRFGQGNLIIGSNGAGKSNILEALGVLAAALSNGIDPTSLGDKGVRLSVPSLFKSAFKNQHLPKTFRMEACFENGKYEFSVRAVQNSPFLEFFSEALYEDGRKIFGRSPHGISFDGDPVAREIVASIAAGRIESSRSVWSVMSPLMSISSEFRREIEDFSGFAIYAPQTAVMRGLAVDPRAIEPLGLTGAGLAAAINYMQRNLPKTVMQDVIDVMWRTEWTNQVQTGPVNPNIIPTHVANSGGISLYLRDRFMHGERNYLSPHDASEGSLYLAFVTALLGHPNSPNAFALDNVDGTLNPRMVKLLTNHILKMISGDFLKSEKQIFMTSHHPSALDSFDIFNVNHGVFVCHRAKSADRIEGETLVERLLPPEGMTKDRWVVAHGAESMSTLFLKDRIPDAL